MTERTIIVRETEGSNEDNARTAHAVRPCTLASQGGGFVYLRHRICSRPGLVTLMEISQPRTRFVRVVVIVFLVIHYGAVMFNCVQQISRAFVVICSLLSCLVTTST